MDGAIIEQINFRGWENAYRISNGIVSLVVVPSIGGRIMSYELGAQQFFYINPELEGQLFTYEQHIERGPYGWKNYGGDKTWPAPQGWPERDKWPGPPDPVLDGGPFTVLAHGVANGIASITMRSQPDPYTSTQITLRLSLGANTSAAHLHIEMQNISDEPVRWSVWDVAQLDCTIYGDKPRPDPACTVYLPLHSNSQFAQGYHLLYGPADNPTWRREDNLLLASYRGQIGKVGVDKASWLGFTRQTAAGTYAFTERFSYTYGESYPDDGVNAECWSNGPSEEQVADGSAADFRLWYMEMEALGPLRTLKPDESQSLDIDWGVAATPGPIVSVGQLGCVNRPHTLTPVADGLVASGSFGLFYPGKVAMLATEAAGQQRYLDTRWTVSAGSPLIFSAVHIPIDTTHLSLMLHGEDGELIGEVDTWAR